MLCKNIFFLRCHAHIVRDGDFSHKVEGNPNCMIGSKTMAFLLESVKPRVIITPHIGTAEIVP